MQTKPGHVTTDAARGLDVLGRALGLTGHHHQPEPLHVDADGDHVGGEHDVDRTSDSVLSGPSAREAVEPPSGSRISGMSELDPREVSSSIVPYVSVARAQVARLAASSRGRRVSHVVIDQSPHATELAQRVEVADQRHPRVGRLAVQRRTAAAPP